MARSRTVKKIAPKIERQSRIKDSGSVLSVPDEVLKKCALMTVLGRNELTVEGHEGILNYETECIRIRLKNDVLSVGGHRLVIDYYNDEELKIIGCIERICWESR